MSQLVKNKSWVKVPLTIVAIILVATFLAYSIYEINGSEPVTSAESYPMVRTIRYSFTVHNKTGQLLKNAKFWIYGPVQKTSFQKALDINSSHPYQLEVDELGNQQLIFNMDFPPYGSKIVSITANIALASKPNRMPNNSTENLEHQKYVEVNDESITELARQLGDDEPIKVLNRAFKWVAENIVYAGYIEDDRGALYALKNRLGDCTEYMYLFSALARSHAIPARGIGGYVVAEDSMLKARDFHNWAEVHVNGEWRVVDPQNKKFLEEESSYISMRVLSNKNNSLLENTHGFSYGSKGLDLRMN